MRDEDGYPTEESLELIKAWDYDFIALMDYIRDKCWWMPSWGWHERDDTNELGRPVKVYEISTGGWSGNEDIIGALRSNHEFWMMYWVQSRVGGHFIFEVVKHDSESEV